MKPISILKSYGPWLLVIVCAAWLLWMTMRPNPQIARELTPLTTPAANVGISYYWLISIAGNIVVFMPLGAGLTLALRRISRPWLWAILGGTLFSLTIELLQMTRASRISAPDDVALNALGTALGSIIIWQIYLFFARRPQGAREK